jgi:hypothetical protein
MLREDLELVGNARVKDIESAQQKLVIVVRRLIASGEAAMKEPGSEDGSAEPEMSEAEMEAMMAASLAAGDGGGDVTTLEGMKNDESDQMDIAA